MLERNLGPGGECGCESLPKRATFCVGLSALAGAPREELAPVSLFRCQVGHFGSGWPVVPL